MAAQTDQFRRLPPEVVAQIAGNAPAQAALFAAVNTSIRTQSGAAAPKWPRVFHVFLDAYMQASDSERRESMLAALEAQATRFSLTSISMPDFELDAPGNAQLHPPMLAPERGAVRLAAVMERCPALETLDVARTRVDRWGELSDALPLCPRLLRLNLSGQRIYVRNNPFAGVAMCHALTELRLADCELALVAVQLGTALAQCQQLRLLDLRQNDLGGANTTVQPPVRYMSYILAGLMHHQSLEHLDLTSCRLRVPAMRLLGAALSTMLRLEHLDVSTNGLVVLSLLPLIQALPLCPGLRDLRVRKNDGLHCLSMWSLARFNAMRGLASLDLSRCWMAFEDLQEVRHGLVFAAELARCPRLRALNLSENNLGDTFVRGLARALPECASLEVLELADAHISDAGVRALAAGVRLCPWLQRLNVRGNECSEQARDELQRAWSATHATTVGLEL
jgi:Ran GTPase-activating protein (RanGAP) involved in mRNA processing and transport